MSTRSNKVIYICGPMGGCKSDVSLDHCDYNYPNFNEIEKVVAEQYRRDGYAVFFPNDQASAEGAGEAFQKKFKEALKAAEEGGAPVAAIHNPARIQVPRSMFAPNEEETYWRMAMLVDAVSFMEARKQTLSKGEMIYVFTPPAHETESTPEAPTFKKWGDSKGAPIEVFLGIKMLGASFVQAEKEGPGSYRFTPVPIETVKNDLRDSTALKEFLGNYSAPAVPQPAPVFSSKSVERDLSPLSTSGSSLGRMQRIGELTLDQQFQPFYGS